MHANVARWLRPSEVLLLADNEEDVALIRQVAGDRRLHVVSLCPDVVHYLEEGERLQMPQPDLILLDLDLSDQSHCDALGEIKNDLRFRRIPVVVFARDSSPVLVRNAYDLRANACVVKPRDREQFAQAVANTLTFWLTAAPAH